MSDATFTGKHALVLGGAKGIGAALCAEFGRRGARVSVGDIDEVAAAETAAAIRDDGGEAGPVGVDVLSADSIVAAVAAAEARFGPVDILVNNVGAILNGTLETIPVDAWERIEQLNHGAVVRGLRAVLPAMLARGSGHIACTASVAGLYPYASSRLPYAASKAAVISLCQNLALDCEPQGVRVSCLIPGPVKTGIGQTMVNYAPDLPMRGPGSDLAVLTAEEAARNFADGMAAGRILILSDPTLWAIVQEWAADPDAFVRARIAQAARGQWGLPGKG